MDGKSYRFKEVREAERARKRRRRRPSAASSAEDAGGLWRYSPASTAPSALLAELRRFLSTVNKQVLEEKTALTKRQESLLKRDNEAQSLRGRVEQERARVGVNPGY